MESQIKEELCKSIPTLEEDFDDQFEWAISAQIEALCDPLSEDCMDAYFKHHFVLPYRRGEKIHKVPLTMHPIDAINYLNRAIQFVNKHNSHVNALNKV